VREAEHYSSAMRYSIAGDLAAADSERRNPRIDVRGTGVARTSSGFPPAGVTLKRRSPAHSRSTQSSRAQLLSSTGWPQGRKTGLVHCVVLDVEGTLVDCAAEATESWRLALEEFGHDFSGPTLHRYSGMDTNDMLRILLPGTSKHEKDGIKKRQGEIYRSEFLPHVRSFPGVRKTIEALTKKGHRIGLATTCQSDELEVYLKVTHIGELVDAIACGDDKAKGKPHRDLFSLALSRLQARKNAIAVGDTPYDAIAATRAGIRVIGTTGGGFSAQELKDAGCQDVISKFAQLLEYI
jgi:phosphoglycolate phosphatase-like HAD superfamily hydrolase